MRAARVFGSFVVFATLLSCGGAGTSHETRLSQVYCERAAQCGRSEMDPALCVQLPALQSPDDPDIDAPHATERAIEAGLIHVDEGQLQKCLADMRAEPCSVGAGWHYPASCETALTGPRKAGEPCVSVFECAAGLHCVQPERESCGATCEALPEGACRTDAQCGADELCFVEKCVKREDMPPTQGHAENEPCDTRNGGCLPGLVCIPIDGALEQPVCRKLKKPGDACTKDFECSGLKGQTYCDVDKGRCVSKPSTGPCPYRYPDSCNMLKSYCGIPVGAPTTGCHPFKKIGDPCDTAWECGPEDTRPGCEPDEAGVKRCVASKWVECAP